MSPGDIADDRGPYGHAKAGATIYGTQRQTNDAKQTLGDIADDHTLAPEHGRERTQTRKR